MTKNTSSISRLNSYLFSIRTILIISFFKLPIALLSIIFFVNNYYYGLSGFLSRSNSWLNVISTQERINDISVVINNLFGFGIAAFLLISIFYLAAFRSN